MESSEELYPSHVTTRQINRMLSALNLMRTCEEADVILMCGEVEFPVHKIVLKASCPYFKGMFSSKMKEASAEKVYLNDVTPEALGVILDYLYQGKVTTMDREQITTDVLKAAHMLQLTDLFDYCCGHIVEWLSLSNFHQIWRLAELYDLQDIVTQVQCYIIANIYEAVFHPEFLNLTKEELKVMLNFANDRQQITEEMLVGVLNWLRHDLEKRETFSGEIFSLINTHCVSREFMKNLLEYEERTSSSSEISNKLKDLAINVFYAICEMQDGDEDASLPNCNSDATLGMRLVFFSKYRVESHYDSENRCVEKRNILCDSVQELDLHTMTWQPPHKLPFPIYEGVAMCQYGENIYMIGGALTSKYISYNLASNTVNYVDCVHFNGKSDGFLFALDKFLFYVERSTEGLFTGVIRITPGTDKCVLELRIQRPPAGWFSSVFATMHSFYIVYAVHGGVHAPCSVVYNYEINSTSGQFELKSSNTIAYLPQGVKVSFAESDRNLVGLYHVNGHLERLHKDANTQHWITMPCNVTASNINDVNTIFKSPLDASNVVFVSTGEDNTLQVPNLIWKPETGEWIQRSPTKGKCIIPDDQLIQKVYFVR